MTSNTFNIIGFDFYTGLNGKLPPIRLIDPINEYVCFAYPNDFISQKEIFMKNYVEFPPIIKLNEKEHEIFEIYPSIDELMKIPNGFIALFVNEKGIEHIIKEFNKNNEIESLKFFKVTNNGINIEKQQLIGASERFVTKFNSLEKYKFKYNGMYLLMGEAKNINIITGLHKSVYKYNIIGGKRAYNENTIDSTLREVSEELGINYTTNLYRHVKKHIALTKDILQFNTYVVFCIYYNIY